MATDTKPLTVECSTGLAHKGSGVIGECRGTVNTNRLVTSDRGGRFTVGWVGTSCSCECHQNGETQ